MRGTVTGRLIAEYEARTAHSHIILNDPVPGRVEILSGGKTVSTVQAAADGSFSIRVPAGSYTMRGPATTAGPCTSTPRTLRVRPGKASQVLVFCPRLGEPAPAG